MPLSESKFFRPEQKFITINPNIQPDEKGNINCYFCLDCQNCENCIGCIGCTDCTDCTNCKNCSNCGDCYDTINCKECYSCIYCNGCHSCFACDGVVAKNHYGSYCTISDGIEEILFPVDYTLFPDIGSSLYHDKIETFFLINHFNPYNRPSLKVSNSNCYINWKVTRQNRRYWITYEPTRTFYSFKEIAIFVIMNRMQYQAWEVNTYIKECYNLPLNHGLSEIKEFIDMLFVHTKDNSQSFYDEIKTKKPEDCLYNNILFGT